MDPIWIIRLPSVLLRRLKSHEMLGIFYHKTTEAQYSCIMSKILLAAFNENLHDEDMQRIHNAHNGLGLTSEHLEEWMVCFKESLDEIEMDASVQRLLVDKVKAIGCHIVGDGGRHGYKRVSSDMVDELMHDVLSNGCSGKQKMIERLQQIKDNI